MDWWRRVVFLYPRSIQLVQVYVLEISSPLRRLQRPAGAAEFESKCRSHNISTFKELSIWYQFILGFFMTVFSALRIISDYVLFPVAKCIKSASTAPLPVPLDDLVLLSATALAKKIQKRDLSCLEVVSAFIRRTQQVDGSLNAVTDERFADAVEDAKLADEAIRSCGEDAKALEKLFKEKPFLGIPITTKNALAVKGLGHESGLHLRKGMKASEDSSPIATMRRAGAIPFAVTNTPELCLWVETDNTIFGRTNNAYNFKRTSGGSSGGEGAILAACGSPLGIGSDIAGSIRVPASYNGIFGLKPTINSINIDGHWPMPKDILHPLLIAGPMSKHAEDLRPVLKVLVGEKTSQLMQLDDPVQLRDYRVFFIEDFKSSITPKVTNEVKSATRKAAHHLASLSSSKAQKTNFQKLKYAMEIYLAILSGAKCPPFSEELAMLKGEISPGREVIKYIMGKSKHSLPALVVANLEKLTKNKKELPINDKFINMSKQLELQMEEFLKDSIIVCPTLPDIAPYHGLTLLRPFTMSYTGIWNILGFPAVSVPMGFSSEGMPIGVTVVAAKNRDNVCCEAALELEREFGGWVPPFDRLTSHL